MSDGSQQSAIQVTIEDGGAVAKVIIPDDFDPARLDAALLANFVRKRGIVVSSAVEAQLLRVAKTFRDEPGRLEQVIARSTAAIDGKDGRIEWMEGLDPTAGPAGQDDSDVVDYYNQVAYVRAAKGAHVATVHEPTPGEDGCDVTGKTIKAKPGRTCDVKIDPSLSLDGNGRVIAEVDGILEYQHGVLRVSRVLEVRGSIDFSSGNIDFDGAVIVRDGVRDRFEVKATQDIIVDGLIEAATIKCGRNFTCRQGMAAKGQGQLVVDGDAVAGYLNKVKGRIKGNLT
ncbi:MAG: FapA family protein, partial [Phycisphaerales bacterium]